MTRNANAHLDTRVDRKAVVQFQFNIINVCVFVRNEFLKAKKRTSTVFSEHE